MSEIVRIIDRIKVLNGLKSDKEVAKQLNVKADTLSQWKKRNKIPYYELEKYSNLHNVSLNWLLSGKGSMHLQEPSTTQNVNGNGVIISGTNQGTLITGDINISIQKHKKEVTQKEDDLLEAYRTLSNDLQDYYYHQIKADAIETKIKDKKSR